MSRVKSLDTPRDIGQGLVGALGIAVNLATPFLRRRRCHWGLTAGEAARPYVGDDRVPDPAWSWTHAVAIDAPPDRVWPWVAQMGQDRAGFYSYQWLENLVGCRIRNADRIVPEWGALQVGDGFRLHPKAPPLRIVDVAPGKHFVVSDVFDPSTGLAPAGARAERWVHVSWLFLVEPLGADRSRFVSRYRVSYGRGWRMRLLYGPWIIESIGFVMDRRMLLGVEERARR